MSTEPERSFGIKTVLAWCAAVAVACISGTYAFTDNTLKAELEQYKSSHQWQLPQLLKNLGTISQELQSQLKDRTEVERLKEFEKQHAAMFERMKNDLKTATERLEAIEGNTVVLKDSHTVPLGEPGLVLGMSGRGVLANTVYLNVGEESFSLEIGRSKVFKSATTVYTFTYKGKNLAGDCEIIVVRKPLGTSATTPNG